ncbi:MAG: ExeA family protein, partial [Actinomycetota bacterium]
MSRTPFGRDLAPGALFPSRSHQEALARIAWLIAEGALGVLSGEVGSGKTASVRAALAVLDHRHTVLYLGNPAVGLRGYYAHIIETLGGKAMFHNCALIAAAADRLHAEVEERGKRVVVVIDEAHSLSLAQLEELRYLLNDDMDSRSPFACLLVGQPTLRRRLKLGGLAAFDQRIALRYHLDGMDLEETAGYVRHHLALAGRSDPLFSDDAIALIHQTARGLPRAVNN